jgi:membrane AbrB-like protein
MRRLFEDISAGVRAFAPSRFPYLRFAFALLIGLVGALIFVYLNTPLPWMLGALATTTIAALLGARISAPGVARTPMVVIVGVMVGATFTPDILERFPEWWPSLLGLVVLGLVSGAAGLAYFRMFTDFNLPTAYFSAMPGGLIEMVTLADERGADIRTVALVHSVRILVVVFCVPIAVRLIEGVGMGASGGLRPSIVDADLVVFAWLVGTAVVGVVVGYLLRLPAAYLLGPLLVSAVTHAIGLSEFQFPSEILNVAQLVIGASLGCRFAGVGTGTIFRIFGMALGMTLFLLAITAAFALAVARLAGFDFVPVFLAYAPGGLPEMSLVAISLHVEVAFVATHHIVRLFLVMGGAPLAYALLDKPKKPPE